MKANKVVAWAMFATVTLAIAGTACAGSGRGAARASSGRSASSVGGRANMSPSFLRSSNRRFSRTNFSYYPNYGYGTGTAMRRPESRTRPIGRSNGDRCAKTTMARTPDRPTETRRARLACGSSRKTGARRSRAIRSSLPDTQIPKSA